MFEFENLLGPNSVYSSVKVADKRALFSELALLSAPHVGAEPAAIEKQLRDRERLGSTGFGQGVALPHGQFDTVDRPTGLFMRLTPPIVYKSVDGIPVDCVFALFSPDEDGAAHLRALAQVSRRFRCDDFVDKLRGARSDDALFALLAQAEAEAAA